MSVVHELPPLEVVYLLGNSFSGSTVLGFLMAGSPQVLCLGELKMHNRIGPRICSCGVTAKDCPFWSYWDARGYQLYSGRLWDKLRLSARLLLGRPVTVGQDPEPDDDVRFLRAIRSESGSPRYLLDTSKSLWRLAHLARAQGVNLSVIHVRRQMHGTVASFVKRFGRFWRPLAGCLCNNLLCTRFLALHPEVRRLEVRHKDLCDDPDAVLRIVGAFLGVDYGGWRQVLESAEFHVRSGNRQTIQQKRDGLRVHSGQQEEQRWLALFGPVRTQILDLLAPAGTHARRTEPGPTDSAREH